MLFNQPDWRWCHKCLGIFFGPQPAGVCPADHGAHDPTGSAPYTLPNQSMSILNQADPPVAQLGQQGWRYCFKCQGLFFEDSAARSCPGGGLHDASRSGACVVSTTTAVDHRYCPSDFQAAWRRCVSCAGLYFVGNLPPGTLAFAGGACAGAAGVHIADGTVEYLLRSAGPLDVHGPATLLVVAPQAFTAALQPLVDHKIATGIPTVLVDVAATVDAYTGRDAAAMLKQAVGYAVECLGTRYLLLAGDASMIPVRYRWEHFAPGPGQWRDGAYSPTDLYYANLYRDHVREPDAAMLHGEWSDWDADGDGRYNFQDFVDNAATVNPDRVDGYCDLAVGRLPTHDLGELSNYVSKVIAYETGRLPRPDTSLSIVVDAYYDAWASCESEVERRTRLPSVGWPNIDRIGYNFTTANPPTNGVRDAVGEPLSQVIGSSLWTMYIGHGASGGWDIPGSDAAAVAGIESGGNTPVVMAVGCSTGQLTSFMPDGPNRYVDTAGAPHWYWTLPVGSPQPTRVVDFGPNDPQGGAGVPVQEWDAGADGTLVPIVPAEPHVIQDECLTVARQWLCANPAAGAVVYFGEQTVAPDTWGTFLGGDLLHAADNGSLAPQIVGDLWSAACRAYWTEFQHIEDCIGNPRIYLSYMTMYGDPSLRTQLVAAPHAPIPHVFPPSVAAGSRL